MQHSIQTLSLSPFFQFKKDAQSNNNPKHPKCEYLINNVIDGKSCQVILVQNFFTQQESLAFFDHLKTLPFHDEPALFKGVCLRKTLSYGQFETEGRENDQVKYKYSKKTETAINPWDPIINKIRLRIIDWYEKEILQKQSTNTPIDDTKAPRILKRKRCEDQPIHKSNYCLIQSYPNNKAGIGWHADSESDLVDESPIFSMSFGTTREFHICKTVEVDASERQSLIKISLTPGTLLIMAGATQKYYKHRVPVGHKNQNGQRINLTFRTIYEDQGKEQKC